MKIFLKKFSAFLLFAFGFYLVFIVVATLTFPDSFKKNIPQPNLDFLFSNNSFEEVKSKKNVDVLFIGSSHAYRGYDPRIFERYGYTSYNLGSSSQTPIQTEQLLNNYLDQLNPKLIVFDIYPVIFTEDGVESAMDLLMNEKINWNTLKMTFLSNHIKIYNAYIYFGLKQIFGTHPILKKTKKTAENIYVGNGYTQTLKNSLIDTLFLPFYYEKLHPKQIKTFERILKLVNQKKIKSVMIQTPSTKKLNNSIVYREEMENYFIKQKNKYINFNTILSMSDSIHFYDLDHMTQNGVEIFNQELIKVLQQNQLLPPKK